MSDIENNAADNAELAKVGGEGQNPNGDNAQGAAAQDNAQGSEAAKNDDGTMKQEASKSREDWTNADWARHRLEQKARKEYDERAEKEIQKTVNERLEKIQKGESIDDDDRDHELMQYRLGEFVTGNPEFTKHKASIAEAIAENRYPGMGIADVASLVAGRALLAERAQQEAASRNDPGAGASARNHEPKAQEYDKMNLEQLDKIASQSRLGKTFS